MFVKAWRDAAAHLNRRSLGLLAGRYNTSEGDDTRGIIFHSLGISARILKGDRCGLLGDHMMTTAAAATSGKHRGMVLLVAVATLTRAGA